MLPFAEQLEQQGYVLVPDVAKAAEIGALKLLFENADLARAERDGKTYGARNLLGLAEVQQMAISPFVSAQLRPLLGDGFAAVRGIFFDKTEGANWPVLWHQDLSLAVKERAELDGWTGWSVKRGVQHVQAPARVLERMVTMRLHLDDCPAENGALRVIPASHRKGQMSRDAIRAMTISGADTVVAKAGDALFMRPLILHASSPAQTPEHRRVLHLEFAPADLLPAGLEWAETC
jgi:ectoine hydroxylase-related dioxygenase (phytanoyl-CoA dioxygenase family)